MIKAIQPFTAILESFERIDDGSSEWLSKSFERLDVFNKRVSKSFERLDVFDKLTCEQVIWTTEYVFNKQVSKK